MFKTTTDGRNKFVDQGLTIEKCYELADGWTDTAPQPNIRSWRGRILWDESPAGIGTKARWADLLFSKLEHDEVVYVQPRVGWAGMSLSYLAKKYDKKLTLFMPSSKKVSDHQLVCIERGAEPKFRRIAAMPVLNGMAKRYAEENGALFIPLGLDHPMVAVGGVVATLQHLGDYRPEHVVTVVSTGTLTRTLQIALPNAQFHGVAVARNIHDGEVGPAIMHSYHRPFTRDADHANALWSEVHSAKNYDMKGIEYVAEMKIDAPPDRRTLVWNVAGEARPMHLTADDVNGQREWYEVNDAWRRGTLSVCV